MFLVIQFSSAKFFRFTGKGPIVQKEGLKLFEITLYCGVLTDGVLTGVLLAGRKGLTFEPTLHRVIAIVSSLGNIFRSQEFRQYSSQCSILYIPVNTLSIIILIIQ